MPCYLEMERLLMPPTPSDKMTIAIGDVHGQAEALRALLELISRRFDLTATNLVFLGDYGDRGPDSRGVLAALIELKNVHPEVVFLRGNHEQMMLDARDRSKPTVGPFGPELPEEDPARLWLSQGGYETLLSYGLDMEAASDQGFLRWPEALPESHWEFIERTELDFADQKFLFVHAGLLPPHSGGWEYEGMGLDPRLWIREPFLSSSHDFDGRIVVFGHTPVDEPMIARNKIGIDTGAAYGGLTGPPKTDQPRV